MTTEESLPGGDDSSPNTPRTGSGAIWFPASEQAAPISTSLTMLPPDPDAEDVALARELGIPDTAPLAQLCVPGEVYARGLSGYVLWVFGIHHPPVPAPTGPFVYVEPPGGGPPSAYTIQAWQTWVITNGSPVVAEVRWRPERGVTASIRGLEHGHDARGVERARRGLVLLQGSDVLRGRRRLEESPTSPWRVLAEQAIEMMRDDPTLSLTDAAARLGMVDYERAERAHKPGAEKRAEKAAKRKLERWIGRLNERRATPE